MKGREVHEVLKDQAHPKIIHVIASIAEDLSAQKEEIRTMAEMIDQCTNLIMQLGVTIEGATNAVDKLKSIREG